MKKHCLVLSFLIICAFSFSQDTTFVKVYFEPGVNLNSSRVVANKVSGFITCGTRNSQSLLINSDSLANILWSRSLTSAATSSGFNDIISTSDSSYVASGFSFTSGSINTIVCAKFNQVGDTIWARSFLTPNSNTTMDIRTRVIETYDSCYIVHWSNPSYEQTMLVKLSSNGAIIWEKILENYTFNTGAIESLEDSCIYIAGLIYPDGGAIVKLNSSGNILWANNYVDKNFVDLESVSGNLYALYDDSGLGVMKIDTSGTVIWAQKYPINYGSGTITNPTLTVHNDSTLTLQSLSDGWSDAVVKINLSGNILANGSYGFFLSDVARHKYGGSFVVGDGPTFGIKQFTQSHIGVIKTDSNLVAPNCYNGSINLTAIPDSWITTPISFTPTNGIYLSPQSFQLNTIDILDTNTCVTMLGELVDLMKTSVKVFPNWTDGITHFEFSKFGEYEVWLSTVEGKIVSKSSVTGNSGTIDLSNLQTGVYIYTVINSPEKMSGRIIRR